MAETATDVREQAQEKAQQAQDKAQEVASKASDQARTQVDQRSTELGHRVTSTADDIRSVGQQLREQGKDQPARIAEQAAGHVERAGSWLRDSDSNQLLSDVEDFGRRQPWAFALGGLALGIAASRFLKASSTQRYQQRQTQTFTADGAGNGHAPSFGSPASYGRETQPIDAGSRTGVPTTSPADVSRGFGTTPPPPSGGTQER
jgi:metal-dependent amidase/aminoacylase/carboxypeptidase family protein